MPSSATATTATYTLSLHDALPICREDAQVRNFVLGLLGQPVSEAGYSEPCVPHPGPLPTQAARQAAMMSEAVCLIAARPAAFVQKRSEEHTSELQSRPHLVCRLLPRPPPRPTLFPYTTLFRSAARTRRCATSCSACWASRYRRPATASHASLTPARSRLRRRARRR